MSEKVAPNPEIQPLQQFIVKTHRDCNLACDYCYMYTFDQSWREQPAGAMPSDIVDMTAFRIGEHAATHDLKELSISLHGGEPLLAIKNNPDFYRYAVAAFENAVPSGTNINYSLQTNGTLLTPKILDELQDLHIRVGVSLDGKQADNDEHRFYRDGKGSFAAAQRGLHLLQYGYRDIYSGILSVIDVEHDPLETYEVLREFEPPQMDLLLPLGNWTHLPPHHDPFTPKTAYADWLIPIFDRWLADNNAPKIRLFSAIGSILLGHHGDMTQYIGTVPAANIVIEANGDITELDTLRTTKDGMHQLGLNVKDNTFDQALMHPKVRERQFSNTELSPTCQGCDVVSICGGGNFPHRYRASDGAEAFINPSVYCADLQKIIGHIAQKLYRNIRPQVHYTAERMRSSLASDPQRDIDALTLLTSYDKMPSFTKLQRRNIQPLVMDRLGEQGQRLVFVAVRHATTPNNSNPHFLATRRSFEMFLRETQDQERVVMVESGIRVPDATADESYAHGSEGGLAAYYAAKYAIKQICPEPKNQGTDQLIELGFSKEEIAVFLLGRLVPSWHRKAAQGQCFRSFAEDRLHGRGNFLAEWPDFGFTYKQVTGFYKDIYREYFEPEDSSIIQRLTYETTAYTQPTGSRIHQICVVVSHLHNRALIQTIGDLWAGRVSAFIPYGYPEGLIVKPYVESLGKAPIRYDLH